MKGLTKFLLRRWNVKEWPGLTKAVVVMAPHTSKLDFIYGIIYFMSQGYSPKILVKKEMFWWPLGPILKKMGGVPLDRSRKVGQVRQVMEAIESHDNFILVICPEGTRKKVKHWKRGFIKIAQTAEVPVFVGFIDAGKMSLGIKSELDMNGTEEEIMIRLKRQYIGMEGINKNSFDLGLEDEN